MTSKCELHVSKSFWIWKILVRMNVLWDSSYVEVEGHLVNNKFLFIGLKCKIKLIVLLSYYGITTIKSSLVVFRNDCQTSTFFKSVGIYFYNGR